jgi:hypothetical protein
MFTRPFASWQRLFGRRTETPPTEGERRVWVRYPCVVETTLQPAGDPVPVTLSAQVCDISRGGLRLTVNRAFAAGDLLSVELPNGNEQTTTTVLACVVRSQEQEGGEWALGCRFSTPLSNDDLQQFSGKVPPTADTDQRAHVRFPCEAEATCKLVGAKPMPILPAQVCNLSARGIALSVAASIHVGDLLSIELRGLRDPVTLTRLACVVRVTSQTGGDPVLGCLFIAELSDEEMQALL